MEKGEDLFRDNTKRLSVIEGGFFGIQEGFGTKYIAPFALAIGKNNPYINTFIAILHSAPYLIGNLSQLFTNGVMKNYKRKNLLSFFVLFQSFLWLGVLFSGFLFLKGVDSNLSLILLIIFYSALVSSGSFVAPVWASLMKDIVDGKRASYFSRRNAISGFVALISSLIAGIFLDKIGANHLLIGFFLLFLFSFVFRFISGILFLYHYDPEFKMNHSNYFSFKDFIKKYKRSNFVKFTIFISLFILAVSLSSPFFVVYMLKDLNLSYLKWTIITISGSLSSLIFMPFWGNFIDNHGSIKTLKITGIFVSFIPLLWMISYYFNPSEINIVIFLVFLEFFAGCMWSGFNLSYPNFIYDAVTLEKTHLCSAYFNIFYGIGIFIGSIVGSVLLSLNIKLFFVSSIFFVFFISGIFRISAYLLMIPKINEVRDVQNISIEKIFKKLPRFKVKPFIDVFNLKIIRPRPNDFD
jgi:MFS family permease